jgi:hypothetical protein
MDIRAAVKRESDVIKARAPLLLAAACVGLYLYQFWHVWKYAVNLPFWDEWATFTPEQLPAGLSPRWLFAQHNEHRLATTRLLIWFLYRLDGWNVATHQILNFAVYGALVAWLVWMSRRVAPESPAWVHPGFAVFLLSSIAIENHVMAYQSQVHFWLLFFLVAAYLLFDRPQRTSRLLAGSAAATLSVYSLAAGVVSALVLLLSFALFKTLRAREAGAGGGRRRELLQLLLVAALVGGAAGLWTVGYRRPPGHGLSSLFGAAFWEYYLNVISFNFGVDDVSAAAGGVCLAIILAPLCLHVFKERGRLPPEHWAVFTTALACLAVLASISAGRAAFGPLQSKSSRYAEFGMALIPLTALAWGLVLRRRGRLRAAVLVGLWLLLFATFWDNWRFADYLHHHGQRKLGVRCVEQYYLKGGEALCPRIYPDPLAQQLEAAKELDASFYRGLKDEAGAP